MVDENETDEVTALLKRVDALENALSVLSVEIKAVTDTVMTADLAIGSQIENLAIGTERMATYLGVLHVLKGQ